MDGGNLLTRYTSLHVYIDGAHWQHSSSAFPDRSNQDVFKQEKLSNADLDAAYSEALRDTIARLEQTGSPIISDGEQAKPSFATYPLSGLTNLAPNGVVIPFADGHTRQLPRLTACALPLWCACRHLS